jgi:hypothetical protein
MRQAKSDSKGPHGLGPGFRAAVKSYARSIAGLAHHFDLAEVHGSRTERLHHGFLGREPSRQRLGAPVTILNLSVRIDTCKEAVPVTLEDALDPIDLDQIETRFDVR